MNGNSYEKAADVIRSRRPDEYDDAVRESADRGLFYHLSSMRHASLAWYGFRPGSEVLEAGAGLGPLTGLLLQKGLRVTVLAETEEEGNLLAARFGDDAPKICVRGTDDPGSGYDYVICHGAGSAEGLLKETGGVFLELIDDSPDGEEHVRPGINGVPSGAAARRIFELYPGAMATQTVRLAGADGEAGLSPGESAALYPALRGRRAYLRETVFGGGSGSAVRTACLSLDRGPRHAMVTAVCESGGERYAVKRPVYPAGREAAQTYAEHMRDLRSAGVPVLPVEPDPDGGFRTPYCRGTLLAEVIRHLSDLGGSDPAFRHEAIRRVTALLDRMMSYAVPGYIEMIPLNCFLEESGSLRFFDQEFFRAGKPAAFTAYRAVFYLDQQIESFGRLLNVRSLYGRYGITERMRSAFADDENGWVADLRQIGKFPLLYEKAPRIPAECGIKDV